MIPEDIKIPNNLIITSPKERGVAKLEITNQNGKTLAIISTTYNPKDKKAKKDAES